MMPRFYAGPSGVDPGLDMDMDADADGYGDVAVG